MLRKLNYRFPFPKRYWVYVILCVICAVLLILNIFRTDSWTGNTPFSEFTKREWILFMVFAIEELVILCFMSLFSCLGGRIYRKREQAIIAERNGNKFDGIKQGDYDYIWFDFACIERALILRQKDKYVLYVHEYDEHTGKWKRVNQMDEYDNLEQLKEALFFEFDFHCQENALLDEYGIWR